MKLVLFVSLLGILLIISTPLVNSVLVNLINPTETVPLSSSPANLSVDPWPAGTIGPAIISDTLQPYNTTTFHVNVTGVTDLFTWQINMTWDPSILNVSILTAGEFLLRTTSDNGTASLQIGSVINVTDYVQGYSGMAESVLGNASGISVSGSGRLVSIEFVVVGYGSTDLNVTISGTLPTMLLNSTGDSMAFTTTLVPPYFTAGYFRNKYPADIDGDWDCDFDDFLAFAAAYLTTSASPYYDREADSDYDGNVDFDDFLVFAANYLSTFP